MFDVFIIKFSVTDQGVSVSGIYPRNVSARQEYTLNGTPVYLKAHFTYTHSPSAFFIYNKNQLGVFWVGGGLVGEKKENLEETHMDIEDLGDTFNCTHV